MLPHWAEVRLTMCSVTPYAFAAAFAPLNTGGQKVSLGHAWVTM
jgi:hypothetical protein